MTDLTDEEIAKQVQAGESETFGLLIERYEQKMRRYASRFLFRKDDTDDLVQEVFIKAYTNIQSFDLNRKFSPWLYRIAHNEFITALKQRERDPLPIFDPEIIFPQLVAPEKADQEANQREFKELLEKSLDKLSPKYREPLILYYFDELDYKTIAEVLHLPVSTVGVRLNRGKEELKNIVKSIDHTYGE